MDLLKFINYFNVKTTPHAHQNMRAEKIKNLLKNSIITKQDHSFGSLFLFVNPVILRMRNSPMLCRRRGAARARAGAFHRRS